MSTDAGAPLDSAAGKSPRGRPFQVDLRTLIVLVAFCGVILWCWRHLSENSDPVLVGARAIQKQAIHALHSGKLAERVTAIRELEMLHYGDLSIRIPALVAALDDRDTEVRIAAVEALGRLGDSGADSPSAGPLLESAAASLTRRLNDASTTFRVAAVQNLGSISESLVRSGSGGPVVGSAANALMACLNDPEPGVRSAAAISLGKIDSPQLASLAGSSFDRQALVAALGKMLADGDERVRLAAVHAMAAHPLMGGDPAEPLINALNDRSPAIRAAVLGSVMLYRQGLDSWVSPVFQHAEHDTNFSVRGQCFSILSRAFKPPAVTAAAVPGLIASLKSGDRHVRCQAAAILGLLQADARAAIPELLHVMIEPLDPWDPGVEVVSGPIAYVDPASESAWALSEIAPRSAAGKQVIAALIDVVRSGPATRRGSAAAALGKFESAAEEALPVLIVLMIDSAIEHKFERACAAALALGKIAPETPSADQALAALMAAVDSQYSSLRSAAIQAVGLFGSRAGVAIPKLRALSNDSDLQVKNAAVKALLLIEEEAGP
jgi:HEAT repeat protein